MAAWTDPASLEAARAWIEEELDRLGVEAAGTLDEPLVTPWSTVIRVPRRSVGDLWFKANAPAHAYEAAVVSMLGRMCPDRVPELVAADSDRGWMLTRDAGLVLRDLVARERDLRRWLDALPLYAQLQIDVAGQADEFLAVGASDCRLDRLASRFELLLENVRGITPDERARLSDLQPWVQEMCTELAGYAIPETIQHNDLHDGQVFARDGGYAFSDWGESCVSHPFFTMAVTLEGVIAWGLDDVRDSVEVGPFRDAYLEPFSGGATRRELQSALDTALRLGWLCRAIEVQRWAAALEAPARDEYLAGVAIRLRMFLAGLH